MIDPALRQRVLAMSSASGFGATTSGGGLIMRCGEDVATLADACGPDPAPAWRRSSIGRAGDDLGEATSCGCRGAWADFAPSRRRRCAAQDMVGDTIAYAVVRNIN